MDPELQALTVNLAEAAVRNTAASVADRIGAARARKRNEETISLLEEIVNDLIDDKSELVRIANAYEEQLVAQRLSEADVKYITTNVVPILQTLIVNSAGAGTSGASAQQIMDLIRPILSVETVTVLQLLGFNFKTAIGAPLTELVSQLILARVPADPPA